MTAEASHATKQDSSSILDWLDDEVDELNSADGLAQILDGVVDVIYVARKFAFHHGISSVQLRAYAMFKGALRSAGRKDKDLELGYASNLLSNLIQKG